MRMSWRRVPSAIAHTNTEMKPLPCGAAARVAAGRDAQRERRPLMGRDALAQARPARPQP
jgi:hypothetical protein